MKKKDKKAIKHTLCICRGSFDIRYPEFFFKTFNGDYYHIGNKSHEFDRRGRIDKYCCSEWMSYDCVKKSKVLVTQWVFEYHGNKKINFKQFLERLKLLKSRVNLIIDKHNFDPLVSNYTFILLNKELAESNGFNYSLYIGQDIPSDYDCLAKKNNDHTKLEEYLPSFAAQILAGMKWLQEKNLFHGHIDLNSIWINKKKHLLLSDAIFISEIKNLSDEFDKIIDCNEAGSSIIFSPEKQPFKHDERSQDIVDLGNIMASLIPSSTIENTKLSTSFIELMNDFIKQCKAPRSIDFLLKGPCFLDVSEANGIPTDDSVLCDTKLFGHKRLLNEFYAPRFLGMGGYGQVFAARNKLDGKDYAIKLLYLKTNSGSIVDKVINEVKLLSSLKHHDNVVRYVAAWTEEAKNLQSSIPKSPVTNNESSVKSDEYIVFEDSKEREKGNISFSTTKSSSKINTSSSPGESSDDNFSYFGGTDCIIHGTKNSMNGDKNILPRMLYIQMEYCEKNNLRSLIDSGNLKNDYNYYNLIWKIFRQILNGLNHIHYNNIIHRDINPNNIFLTQTRLGDIEVKIGDFGIATLFENNEIKIKEVINPEKFAQTYDVGTSHYIAPEVKIKGKSYDSKCDVFSLGMVLFVMVYCPLKSQMETDKVLENLWKNLIFPHDFAKNITVKEKDKLELILSMMLKKEPDNRPTVDELLCSRLVPIVENDTIDYKKEFGGVIRNLNSRFYKWIIDELFFNKEFAAERQFAHHFNFIKNSNFYGNFSYRSECNLIELECRRDYSIYTKLRSILKLHGLQEVYFPSILPYPTDPSFVEYSKFRVLDKSGCLFELLTDLRHNFANIQIQNQNVRRFAMGKVFTKEFRHLIERNECVLDFISPSQHASACEVLYFINDFKKRLPIISNLKLIMRIGHIGIIKAVCKFYELYDNEISKILKVLYKSHFF